MATSRVLQHQISSRCNPYVKTFIEFTGFTEAVNENIDGISKHRLSQYNAHYLNYNFFTQFPVPVPCEYEI